MEAASVGTYNGTMKTNEESDAPTASLHAWHALIGRAVVSFGILERVTLEWVHAMARDRQLATRLHKGDMKSFAPALRRQLQLVHRKLPPATLRRATNAVDRAERLTGDRNDIAHGWLQRHENAVM